jgi:cell division protease FtsH
LAKAIAGEAGVAYFISAVQNLSNVCRRRCFAGTGSVYSSQKSSAAIIFVDEIDAVGRHRGAGWAANDERDKPQSTVSKMDVFDPKILSLSLLPPSSDILDPCALAAGRFDRQIIIDKPDIKGRTVFKISRSQSEISQRCQPRNSG